MERLQAVEALIADGQPIGDALLLAGASSVEYEQWRSEYGGLLRTLGPLASAPPRIDSEIEAQQTRVSGEPATTKQDAAAYPTISLPENHCAISCAAVSTASEP